MSCRPKDSIGVPIPFKVGDKVVLNKDCERNGTSNTQLYPDRIYEVSVLHEDLYTVSLAGVDSSAFYHTRLKLVEPLYTENDIVPQEIKL